MKAVIQAYGKINLVLDVLRKREDGFHEVAMIMQMIGLADTVRLAPSEKNTLRSNLNNLPNDQSNLAMKAAVLMQQLFPSLPKFSIELEKRIPVAAGLAGGSSDCAAVLMGINALGGLNLSTKELMEIGARLGSDVPFLMGSPTALATGRGEIITPLADCPKFYVVLIKPKFGVSTAAVYQNLHADTLRYHPDMEQYKKALADQDRSMILNGLYNALENSTFALEPTVQKIKEEAIAEGARYTLQSGSGPTVFSLFTEYEEAERFYRARKDRDCTVILTETLTTAQTAERMIVYHDGEDG